MGLMGEFNDFLADRRRRRKRHPLTEDEQLDVVRGWFAQDPDVRKRNLLGLQKDRTDFEDRMFKASAAAQDWGATSVDGHKAMNVQLMGGRYERRILDPMTRKWTTVAVAQQHKNNRPVVESVFGQDPDEVSPFAVARFLGINFRSPYEDRVPDSTRIDKATWDRFEKEDLEKQVKRASLIRKTVAEQEEK